MVNQKSNQLAYVSFSAEIDPNTTEALLAVCANLVNQGIGKLYLLLSSPGGSVMHGLTLYNVLKGLPVTLITHNVGNVNSIANTVFLAGDKRYACPHATFMFHGVGFDVKGAVRFEQKTLRERLDSVEADQSRIGAVIAKHTTLRLEEIEELFFEAKTRDPEYALENGIIHEIRDVDVPSGTPVHQLVFKR